ncbi:MAG: PIN domain-containing protein [Planctomycetota bacterium]|nr:PIN domain-containing protein [Planctomycetota bacterium]
MPLKVVVDTNVFVAGLFWTGPPYAILCAWRDGRVQLAASPEILDEYARVALELSGQYPDVDIAPFVSLVTTHADVVSAPPLACPVGRRQVPGVCPGGASPMPHHW